MCVVQQKSHDVTCNVFLCQQKIHNVTCHIFLYQHKLHDVTCNMFLCQHNFHSITYNIFLCQPKFHNIRCHMCVDHHKSHDVTCNIFLCQPKFHNIICHMCVDHHKSHDVTCNIFLCQQHKIPSCNMYHLAMSKRIPQRIRICLMYTWTLLLRTPPPHPTPTIYETFAHLYDGKRSDDILNKYIYIYNYIYAWLCMGYAADVAALRIPRQKWVNNGSGKPPAQTWHPVFTDPLVMSYNLHSYGKWMKMDHVQWICSLKMVIFQGHVTSIP